LARGADFGRITGKLRVVGFIRRISTEKRGCNVLFPSGADRKYSLSYIPRGTNAAGYHEIKVEVKEPGLKVRARPGYYLASGPES
jgi:hypothetical protein